METLYTYRSHGAGDQALIQEVDAQKHQKPGNIRYSVVISDDVEFLLILTQRELGVSSETACRKLILEHLNNMMGDSPQVAHQPMVFATSISDLVHLPSRSFSYTE